ncbi:MAG TPA: type III-B CRISPR module RAMP protein Cmr4 [Kofleriaceae bacterium]|jgi:CRISPR-associated protein Cmr4|nr:type III-B CRISPR module RAMP protein Cmr4 [Kofleriaceae bacterium]
MKTRPYLLHALSPLHAGTGHAAGIVDLPTARMKATGIPFVPGSSIKGVLREARQPSPKTEAVFGPASKPEDHAGALVVGDARLLALPVRSFRGTFVWATCPLLLTLALRDLAETSGQADPLKPGAARSLPGVVRPADRGAVVAKDSICVHDQKLYLEDLDLPVTRSDDLKGWTVLLAPLVCPGEDIFTKRFAVVDDETMAFLWETSTQIDARVRIHPETRTVASGALWLEESLPPETLLIGLLAADRSRKTGQDLDPIQVLDYALGSVTVLQVGGKATIGRGRCRIAPMTSGHGGPHASA